MTTNLEHLSSKDPQGFFQCLQNKVMPLIYQEARANEQYSEVGGYDKMFSESTHLMEIVQLVKQIQANKQICEQEYKIDLDYYIAAHCLPQCHQSYFHVYSRTELDATRIDKCFADAFNSPLEPVMWSSLCASYLDDYS